VIVAIIQARMSSRRLPGKVLAPLIGRPMLARQLERVSRSRVDQVIVATSERTDDDAIAEVAETEGFACHRGDLGDVLDRFHQVALTLSAEHIVRLTADCPLADHRLIDAVAELHLGEGNDYTSNTLRRVFPHGADVEIMSFDALCTAWRNASEPHEREHVTPYIYGHPESFKLGSLDAREDTSCYRLTVDYPEDLRLIETIFVEMYTEDPDFSMQDVIALLQRRPELLDINAARNPGYERALRLAKG
jgi:spore coat polysaccharide biosynthesis protein SpsF